LPYEKATTNKQKSFSAVNSPLKAANISRISLIAALYAAMSLLTITLLQGFAWGYIQFRVSEALCILALLTPAAIPGLTVGCLLANSISIAFIGSGPLGLLDVVFGSLATWAGARWMWRFRHNRPLALAGPVIFNALIVAGYLPLIVAASGFYSLPIFNINLNGFWPAMYAFGFVCIALGESLVIYGLGWPLVRLLEASGLAAKIRDDNN
jgi:uncharacterized membrane protein